MTDDYDKSIHSNRDARAWAKFFVDTVTKRGLRIEDIDEELMTGWFANAMVAMYDSLKREILETLDAKWNEENK